MTDDALFVRSVLENPRSPSDMHVLGWDDAFICPENDGTDTDNDSWLQMLLADDCMQKKADPLEKSLAECAPAPTHVVAGINPPQVPCLQSTTTLEANHRAMNTLYEKNLVLLAHVLQENNRLLACMATMNSGDSLLGVCRNSQEYLDQLAMQLFERGEEVRKINSEFVCLHQQGKAQTAPSLRKRQHIG